METQQPTRVVVVGGGFGGLEAALYLRQRLADRVRVTLVSDRDHFLFRPFLTYLPFGLVPESVKVDLADAARAKGATFVQGRVDDVRPADKEIRAAGRVLAYDALVVATGAAMGPETVPGLHEHAYVVWRQADMERLQTVFQQLLRDVEAGHRRRVVFLVPPGSQWPGPLYELAFMLEAWLHWKKARDGVDLCLLTAEHTYVEALGTDLHEAVERELGPRRIEGRTGQAFDRVEAGAVIDADGRRVPCDVLIASPTYVASTAWPNLPVDERGFLRTVPATRQVEGHPDVYAVGDASDYPVKQAYLALLQADAAAEHLAARVLQTDPAFPFDPSGLWLLEQLDQAVLTRVPLDEHGQPSGPAEIDPLSVGQLRRMMVSAYLPRQFGDNPLYAGLFWKGTQVGMKVLRQLTR